MDNYPLKYEWVLFLDADEQMTPQSQNEIELKTQNAQKECCGFYLGFDYYFLNKRIRKAMYPHIRLIKKREVHWRADGAREVCSTPDDSPLIEAKLIHNDHRGLKHWFTKQAHNAELEAMALNQKKLLSLNNVKCENQTNNPQIAKSKLRHRLRKTIDNSCPPFIRTLLLFSHHLVFKTDIRDSWAGLVYALLYGLCYPIMIDAKYIQLRVGGSRKRNSKK